ncbi:DUF2280 domain-containing protein [Shinella sp.]|uniref:DUF2280 domain-containing protein n=1 Tax=Shinella sp. TaxID=1870904 RepID=UPI00289D1137|nr:DUF2280 domain-containing protein [Shinella sp.]
MAGPKLSDEVKAFIIQSLACFDGLAVVVAAVKREYGIEISKQLCESHDPTKKAGAKLGERWRVLFDETRKSFLEDTSTIAISHRAVRLRALQRMADKAEGQGNMVLASSLLEQAAKEVGNSYTNHRKLDHTSSDGTMTPPPSEIRIVAADDDGTDQAS